MGLGVAARFKMYSIGEAADRRIEACGGVLWWLQMKSPPCLVNLNLDPRKGTDDAGIQKESPELAVDETNSSTLLIVYEAGVALVQITTFVPTSMKNLLIASASEQQASFAPTSNQLSILAVKPFDREV